ncbi:hypothetical protein KGQ71_03010, partial [Patescibacteria group bacterium]|nr:hypothetical protein [Patescibacteria group bacterium]
SHYDSGLTRVIAEELRPALTGSPATLYDLILRGVETVDQLQRQSGLLISELQSVLSVLELDGYIYYKGDRWLKT